LVQGINVPTALYSQYSLYYIQQNGNKLLISVDCYIGGLAKFRWSPIDDDSDWDIRMAVWYIIYYILCMYGNNVCGHCKVSKNTFYINCIIYL